MAPPISFFFFNLDRLLSVMLIQLYRMEIFFFASSASVSVIFPISSSNTRKKKTKKEKAISKSWKNKPRKEKKMSDGNVADTV